MSKYDMYALLALFFLSIAFLAMVMSNQMLFNSSILAGVIFGLSSKVNRR